MSNAQVNLKHTRIPSAGLAQSVSVCESTQGVWCWVAAGASAKLLIPVEQCLIGACALLCWNNLLKFRDLRCLVAESKRVNQPFDLLYKKYGKYGKQSVLRRNSKSSMKERNILRLPLLSAALVRIFVCFLSLQMKRPTSDVQKMF